MITKKKFITLMKKGWKELDYAHAYFWMGARGASVRRRDRVSCACAIGAAAWADGATDPKKWARENLGGGVGRLWRDITEASDTALLADDEVSCKARAIRDVSAIRWRAG